MELFRMHKYYIYIYLNLLGENGWLLFYHLFSENISTMLWRDALQSAQYKT